MCNREFYGCGCNRVYAGCGCQREQLGCGCGCNRCGGRDEAWYEAERMMRAAQMRRCREDRCAREFCRCMNHTGCGR